LSIGIPVDLLLVLTAKWKWGDQCCRRSDEIDNAIISLMHEGTRSG
jgi:hypothetical protein